MTQQQHRSRIYSIIHFEFNGHGTSSNNIHRINTINQLEFSELHCHEIDRFEFNFNHSFVKHSDVLEISTNVVSLVAVFDRIIGKD